MSKRLKNRARAVLHARLAIADCGEAVVGRCLVRSTSDGYAVSTDYCEMCETWSEPFRVRTLVEAVRLSLA